MERFSEFVSTLLSNDVFLMLFWALISSPIALWQMWYFRGKKQLSETELINISSEFEGINSSYVGFSLIVLIPLLFLSMMLFLSVGKNWTPLIFGIRLFPLIIVISAAYGIHQGSFAIYKGVYPMAKSLSYIHDEKSIIRRVAKLQIIMGLVAYGVLFLWAMVS
jgi:hypothetical protein